MTNKAERFEESARSVDVTRSQVLAQFRPALQWPYDTVLTVAADSLTDRNLERVSRKHGVPQQTVWQWSKQAWWEPLLSELRSEHSAELEAAYLGCVFNGIEAVRERLELGDWHMTKDGPVRMPIKGLDAAKIVGIFFDKRQVLRHQPTSISGSTPSELTGALDAFMRERESKLVSSQPATDPSAPQEDAEFPEK